MLVSWFRDGQEVDQSWTVRIDEVTSLLVISELTSLHAGNYSCVAKNEVAVVSVTERLVVKGRVAAPEHFSVCMPHSYKHHSAPLNDFLVVKFFTPNVL